MKKKDYISLAHWYLDYADKFDPPISTITEEQFTLSNEFWRTLLDTHCSSEYNQKCRDIASALYSEAQTL